MSAESEASNDVIGTEQFLGTESPVEARSPPAIPVWSLDRCDPYAVTLAFLSTSIYAMSNRAFVANFSDMEF